MGESGPNASVNPFFSWVRLALGWGVGQFHCNICPGICFPTQHNLVYRKHVTVLFCGLGFTVHVDESRSPRWSYQQWSPSNAIILLIVLVLEFEFHRGEILNLFATIKKAQLLRTPSVGRRNSTRVGEGRKDRSLLAIKVKRGEKGLLCDPGSELRLGGREKRRAKIINGMEKKKKKHTHSGGCYQTAFMHDMLLCCFEAVVRVLLFS